MSEKKLSRNALYEQKKKAKGLAKVTLWIPEGCRVEMSQMAEFLCEAKELGDQHIPYMARSLVTGRMKRAVD